MCSGNGYAILSLSHTRKANTMKTCTKCGIEKPLDQFYKQGGGKQAYRGSCKLCSNKATSKRQKETYKGGMGHNQGRVELPSADRLNELFKMDGPDLVRRVSRGNSPEGAVVGKLRSDGYRRVWVDGVHALIHRVVWKMHTSEEPPKYLDHIDGDRANNRFSNLREADHSKNMWNRCDHKLSSSGFIGVVWHDKTKDESCHCWKATLGKDWKPVHTSRHDNIEDALRAYEKAVIDHHGEYGHRKIDHNRKMAKAMGIEF